MVRDICDPFDDSRDDWEKATSVYEFHVHTMDREIVSMKQYHGHPLIIVNVALNSTTTSSDLSFKELIELDKKYYSKGLRILAFPCNDLIKKDEDVKLIKDYVWDHHVKFQVFDFISLSGYSQNKLFKYLRNEAGGVLFGPILWDFTKFIIDKDGHVVERFGSKIPIDILEKYL